MRKVVILGLIFILILSGCKESDNISAEDIKLIMNNGRLKDVILLDVRDGEEYSAGHIPESVCLPLNTLKMRIAEIDRQKPIIVYCKSGCSRSQQALMILKDNGFRQVRNMVGGINEWQRIGGRIEGKEERIIDEKTCPAWQLGKGCED